MRDVAAHRETERQVHGLMGNAFDRAEALPAIYEPDDLLLVPFDGEGVEVLRLFADTVRAAPGTLGHFVSPSVAETRCSGIASDNADYVDGRQIPGGNGLERKLRRKPRSLGKTAADLETAIGLGEKADAGHRARGEDAEVAVVSGLFAAGDQMRSAVAELYVFREIRLELAMALAAGRVVRGPPRKVDIRSVEFIIECEQPCGIGRRGL